jgi:tetratricopeptide (TPR) repeat protein
MPNSISNFWQELKRRGVLKVVAMYAGAAYILIELANNVSEPLNLPAWAPRLVILLALIGFPIAAVLSWIFDITPQGIQKTESFEFSEEQKVDDISPRRKLRASDIIIACLFVIVCVLIYPKIFNREQFPGIVDDEGRISLAVMPFTNMTNDTLWDVWQTGIQYELITNLSNSKALTVRQFQSIYSVLEKDGRLDQASLVPSVARDISQKLQVGSYLYGVINSSGTAIRINAHLTNVENQEVYRTFALECSTEEEIFGMTDSLAGLVRNYLEIQVLGRDADYDVKEWATTSSAEAYRYFMKAMRLFHTGERTAIEMFKKVLELDSTFYSPRIWLSLAYLNHGYIDESKQSLMEAYHHKEMVSYPEQLYIESVYHLFEKDLDSGNEYIQLLLELYPKARGFWYQKGFNHYRLEQTESAVHCLEEALKIDQEWGGGWEWFSLYSLLGTSLHDLGDHERENEIYNLGLSILPDHPFITYCQTMCACSQPDTSQCDELVSRLATILSEEGMEKFWIDYSMGLLYAYNGQFDMAMDIFNDLMLIDPGNPAPKGGLAYILIDQDIDISKGMDLVDEALNLNPVHMKSYLNFDKSIIPTLGSFQYTKGLGYYKLGEIEMAQTILEEAWNDRIFYNHDHYLLLQQVKQEVAARIQ